MIFQCIHQTKISLIYQMPILFSKEYVISGSHPDNLVCRWDPLDPPKSDPSDSDCPGHLTYFQPCYRCSRVTRHWVSSRFEPISYALRTAYYAFEQGSKNQSCYAENYAQKLKLCSGVLWNLIGLGLCRQLIFYTLSDNFTLCILFSLHHYYHCVYHIIW